MYTEGDTTGGGLLVGILVPVKTGGGSNETIDNVVAAAGGCKSISSPFQFAT